MCYKVLIVEDEHKIRRVIKDYLEVVGIQVFEAENGYKGFEILKSEGINLVLLDVMLEGIDGFEICEKIRGISKDIIIVMLTAKSQEDDKLKGYTLGADDYVTKPFSAKVLQMKVKALLDRSKQDNTTMGINQIIINEDLVLDRDSRKLSFNGVKVDITTKEYELLDYLAENKNIALSREQIIERVWGVDFEGLDRTVDTTIKRLQGKVNKRLPIIAVRGYGYRLEV